MVKQNHLKIFKTVFSITKNSNKVNHIAGDFNLNLLDHENNRKVKLDISKWYGANYK